MVSIFRLRLILVGLVVFRCAPSDQRGTSPTYAPSSPSKPCAPTRDELAGADFVDYSQASAQMSQSVSQQGAARDATCSATKCFARGTFCACGPGATAPASDWTEVSSCPLASSSIKCCAFGEYDPAPAGWGCFCSTSSCAEFGEPALHVSCNVATEFSAPQCTMPASSFGAGASAATGSAGSPGATGSSGATDASSVVGPTTTTNPCASPAPSARTSTPSAPKAISVAWLEGSYSVEGKISYNTYYRAEERAVSFDTKAKTYTYREGTYTSEAAPFEVTSTAIRFVSGPLQGKDVALPIGVIASCRILMVAGVALSREALVADCPFPAPKRTAAECALVGRHMTESKSGSSSSGSSDSTSIVLEKDGFYRKVVGHSSWACYSTRCSTLYSAGPAEVGAWSLSGGQITGPNISAQALADYDFTPADGACQ